MVLCSNCVFFSDFSLNPDKKGLLEARSQSAWKPPNPNEFWSILHEKEENAEAATRIARQLENEDLGHLVGPQLERLKNQLKKVHLCSEVVAIQGPILKHFCST